MPREWQARKDGACKKNEGTVQYNGILPSNPEGKYGTQSENLPWDKM